jgi:hypothetical protein
MIAKSCRLFGQDHATKQVIRAKWRFDLIPFRSSLRSAGLGFDPVLMIRMLIVGYVFAIRSERAIAYRWVLRPGD